MSQRVVVWRPNYGQEVRVIGPFRSEEKAQTAKSVIELIEDRVDADPSFVPEVITLGTLEDALAEIAEMYP